MEDDRYRRRHDPAALEVGLSLAAFGGRVYAVTADTSGRAWTLLALRAADGKVAWRLRHPPIATDDHIAVMPVGANQVMMVDDAGAPKSSINLLDAARGIALATFPGPSQDGDVTVCHPAGTPAIAIQTSGAIHTLSADRARDRTIKVPRGDRTQVEVVITDTTAYVRRHARGAPVISYDLATGSRAWTAPAPDSPADPDLFVFDRGFAVDWIVKAARHGPGLVTFAIWR